MRRVVPVTVLFAAAGLAVACGGAPGALAPAPDGRAGTLPLAEQVLTPGRTSLRVATIRFIHDPEVVDVPATAQAGRPFTAHVTTYGGGCIAEDTTVVTVGDARADVVPYQRVHTPGDAEVCTQELRVTPRPVRIAFATPGSDVVVTGRAARQTGLVTVERVVTVR